MTVIDLRFTRARSTEPSDELLLLFGAGSVAPPPPPPPPPPPAPPPGELRVVAAARWRGAVGVAAPAVAARWRGQQGALGAAWRTSWQASEAVTMAWRSGWGASQPVAASWLTRWRAAVAMGTAARAYWQSCVPLERQWRAPWRTGVPAQAAAEVLWRGAVPICGQLRAPWRGAVPAVAWAGQVVRLGVPMRSAALASWRAGVPLVSHGGPWVRPTVPPPPPPTCRIDDASDDLQMLFTRAASPPNAPLVLRFACWRPALVVVPVQRVYIVQVSGTLVRVSDGAEIPCYGMSLQLDVDSWTWGFSASVRASAWPLLEPAAGGEPVMLQATLSGEPVRVIVEGISRERTFGRESLRITGRGISALLADPYMPVSAWRETAARTSQQLLDQALPSGWTADFGLTPWLVPGGVWSHQGTPISAARAIAAAGGGYLQPHPVNQQLLVRPRYPWAPWDWATQTPDLHLPGGVVQREGVELVRRPSYNRVYVSGTSAGGLLVDVKRLGSSGDLEAPMVVDPLITHADAGRQRGLAVLSDTGQQALVSLRLRLLAGVGIVPPGRLVRYVDDGVTRLGLSRAVSVEYGGGADLWQTIRLETHV